MPSAAPSVAEVKSSPSHASAHEASSARRASAVTSGRSRIAARAVRKSWRGMAMSLRAVVSGGTGVVCLPRGPGPAAADPLQGVGSALTCAHARHAVDGDDPDLAVPDLTGLRSFHNKFHDLVGVAVVNEDVEANLRHEVDDVLRTAVHLRVPALPAVPLHLAHCHALDSEGLQGGLDVLELERFDDRGDEFHARTSPAGSGDPGPGGACAVCMTPAPTRVLPPKPLPSSYADSACRTSSMPTRSSSGLSCRPMTRSMTLPMTSVPKNEYPTAQATTRICSFIRCQPPP